MEKPMSNEFIRFSCPYCGKKVKTDTKYAGRHSTCSCGMDVVIPGEFDPSEILGLSPDDPDTMIDPVEDTGTEVVTPVAVQRSQCRIAAYFRDVAYCILGLGALSGLVIVLVVWSLDNTTHDLGIWLWIVSMAIMLVWSVVVFAVAAPYFALASILQDARTTADCSRQILSKINSL